jgi:hypothetical protein
MSKWIVSKSLTRLMSWFSLAAVVITCSVFPVMNEDIGWHLATGNWIIDNHQIPTKEAYSFTVPDREWVDHWWLSQVILALVHRVGGFNGLILSNF